jgi:2-desacetyl-2-hydroxyethyl bacteriochlorophyllide A dehydrogenase
MRTVVLEEPGRLAAASTPQPGSPPPGAALVRVRRVGVCGTDFHAWHGRQPFFTFPRILGHELGVEVLEVGRDVTTLSPGDRCAVEPYLNCGACAACRRGRGNCCERLQVLGVHVDGGMRELLHVPAGKLHPSRTLDLDTLALVETLSVGAHAVARGGPTPSDLVLVVGAGPIGLSVATFAAEAGARVAVMDVSSARLDFCRRVLPSVGVILAAPTDGADGLAEALGGEAPTHVFDATGNRESMSRAITRAGHAATVVYVGLFRGDLTFANPEFHKRELTLLGSRNALAADFRRVIDALERGRVDITPWITHRAPIEEVPSIFPGWTDPASGVIKAIIDV